MAGQAKIRHWRTPKFGDKEPSPIDWARMAAYIDGEGCIETPQKQRSGKIAVYLCLHVANTDLRLILWCAEKFGGNYYVSNRSCVSGGKNAKDCWHWTAPSTRAAWILHNCLPYFIIKREQAELGIALQESITGTLRLDYHRVTPPHLEHERLEIKAKLNALKRRGRPDSQLFNFQSLEVN
jgi:hypothetical protein